MTKKLLPVFLLCFLLAAGLLSAVSAANDDIVDSGDCGADGSNVKWTLDSKGTLTISGNGAMYDYGAYRSYGVWYSKAPWVDSENGNMITSLLIGNGIINIGTNAFLGLERLTKVSLPDTLIRIKAGAFEYCSSLTRITFPDSVSSIEDEVFCGCSNLVSFTIPESVAGIGAHAFEDCDRLTSIVIPTNVENVSVNAFMSCDRLKRVTILGDIPIIKAETFSDCPALEEITIPDSVLIIEENAFSGCAALKDVYYTGTADMWKKISVDVGNTALDNAAVHCDTSPEAAYQINGITVSGGTEGLGAMPYGTFYATVSITNRASGSTPLIFLAAYSDGGKFQDFMYVTVKEPIGGTVEVTLPIDNSAMNIAELRAFAVSSFSDLTPIGNPVVFPEPL